VPSEYASHSPPWVFLASIFMPVSLTQAPKTFTVSTGGLLCLGAECCRIDTQICWNDTPDSTTVAYLPT
jgi:hypothetical protein